MNYVLTRFDQNRDIRRFHFTGVLAAAKERLEFLVGVDLTQARKYGIPTQELPLLCRRFLEETPREEGIFSLIFAEANMADYATQRDTEKRISLAKRRAYFKPTKKTGEEPSIS
ncbi:MAG: hypothetical protein ABI811_08520 [Acidobacteriota bacterium]